LISRLSWWVFLNMSSKVEGVVALMKY